MSEMYVLHYFNIVTLVIYNVWFYFVLDLCGFIMYKRATQNNLQVFMF